MPDRCRDRSLRSGRTSVRTPGHGSVHSIQSVEGRRLVALRKRRVVEKRRHRVLHAIVGAVEILVVETRERCSTVSRIVLLGIVPVLLHTPPTAAPFSMITTRLPDFAAWMAALCPPGPEPITIKSYACL